MSDNDKLVNSMWKMSDEIQKLRKENEVLKRGEETFKDSIHKLLQVQYKLADNCKKYRKALEEIREMSEKHLDAKEICYATQIIDKINEVLDEQV